LALTWNENLCNMNQAYIISRLIFIIIITVLTGEKLNNSNNTYLPHYVIPVHYHIKLNHLSFEKIDFNLKYKYISFYGKSSTTINILQSTKYIKLHMLNLIIHREEITLIKNNGVTYALKNYTEIYDTNLLEFCFFNILSPGLYTLKMEFVGHLIEKSAKNVFKSFYTNKKYSKT